MRVLLLSDMHANLDALEACLEAAPPHDVVANLGDVVGYGACPNEVIATARALGSLIVRGNHDKACSGVTSLEYFNPVAGLAVLWTQRTLTGDNREWLRVLPEGPLQIPGLPGVQFAHGSPLDEDEYLMLPLDAVEPLVDSPVPLVFFGHTHVQGGFSLNAGDPLVVRPRYHRRDRLETCEQSLEKDARYLINPGSVGQPRDGDRRAGFALYDSGASAVTFYRVPYDFERAQRRIRDAGLPERLAARLAEGK